MKLFDFKTFFQNLDSKYQLIYGILIVGLIVSFAIGLGRLYVEYRNKDLEILMRYDDLLSLEMATGTPLAEIFPTLAEGGITTISLEEDTVNNLVSQGRATWVTGKEIIDSSRMAQLHNYILDKVSSGKVLNASTSFILFDDLETYNRALAAFILAFGETRVTELGGQILEIKGGREEIGRIGFGLSARIVESLQQAGFAVIPQLVSSPRESEVELLNKIRKIQQFKNIKTILFSGKEVPGHRGGMDVVISQMKDLKLNFGFLEFTPQAGAARLAEHLPERTIIVHMITNARMNQLDPDQVANQFVRAVLERGARILYLRPYLNSEEHESLLVDNRTYLVNLKSRLENLGFRLSPIDVPVMTNLRHISFIEILMITLAMSMLLVLVVEKVYVLDIKYVQYLIAGVVIFNILAFFSGHLLATRRLFALMTAVVTPFWAMVQSFPLEETLATTKTEFKTRFQEVIKN